MTDLCKKFDAVFEMYVKFVQVCSDRQSVGAVPGKIVRLNLQFKLVRKISMYRARQVRYSFYLLVVF